MAIYTFYLCAGGGAATTFEAFELGGDEFAPERALKMLSEHRSCAYVALWSEDLEALPRHSDPRNWGGARRETGAGLPSPP